MEAPALFFMVICRDSYPLGLGFVTQSLRRDVSGSYSSVTYEYTFQHKSFSTLLSGSQSIMKRMAKTS